MKKILVSLVTLVTTLIPAHADEADSRPCR